MGFEIKDLTGGGRVLERVVAEISKGIGCLYRPRAIRQEAAAEADKHRILERAKVEAELEARDMRLQAKLVRVDALLEHDPELRQRAHQRLLQQELQGQQNIEAIAEAAIAALPATVPEETLDDDWRRRFFRYAEDVTNSDMQQIWGRILAGAIAAPRAYSLKTLDVLRNLGSREAELFRRLCRLALDNGSIPIIGDDVNESFKSFGIDYPALLALRDFGLLHEADTLRTQFLVPVDTPAVLLTYNAVQLQFTAPTGFAGKSYPVLVMTVAGRELKKLMAPDPDEGFLRRLRGSLNSLGIVIRRGSTVVKDGTSIMIFEDIPFPDVTPSAAPPAVSNEPTSGL